MKQLTMLALAFSVACSGSKDDSAAVDTAGGDDTTDTTDTTDTSGGEATTWGCNAPDFGICYDMYAEEGWDAASSEETCSAVASQYGIATDFINDDYGCPVDNSVGACDLPASGDFASPVTAWYDGGSWDATSAEGACTGAGGSFYQKVSVLNLLYIGCLVQPMFVLG